MKRQPSRPAKSERRARVAKPSISPYLVDEVAFTLSDIVAARRAPVA